MDMCSGTQVYLHSTGVGGNNDLRSPITVQVCLQHSVKLPQQRVFRCLLSCRLVCGCSQADSSSFVLTTTGAARESAAPRVAWSEASRWYLQTALCNCAACSLCITLSQWHMYRATLE